MTKDGQFLKAMRVAPIECPMCELSEHAAALAREELARIQVHLDGASAREDGIIGMARDARDAARKWETRCWMAVLVAGFLLAALVAPHAGGGK